MIYNKQGGNNASLGLNKQTYNMARLKVKQISDFQTEVQSLITANDSNDAASIAALSTAVALEQGDQDASINSILLAKASL